MMKKEPEIIKIDFPNDDGTVDEWVWEKTNGRMRIIQVTSDIRRRTKK